MFAALMDRPGNASLEQAFKDDFPVYTSFDMFIPAEITAAAN